MAYTSQIFATGAELDAALVAALDAKDAVARAEAAAARAEAAAESILPTGNEGDFVVLGADGALLAKPVAIAEEASV